MAKSRQSLVRKTVVKPLGMMTTPNSYGLFPAGALRDAKNCVMRRPGEVMCAPAGTNYTTFGSTNYKLRHLAPMDAGHVIALWHDNSNNWSASEGVPGGTQNACTFAVSSGSSAVFSQSRVGSTRSRDRLLMNSELGVMVCDYMQPANSTQRTFRWAGIPQPGSVGVTNFSYTATGAIPDGVMVAYVAIITREYADGYILKSVPSVPVKMLNTGGGSAVTWTLAVNVTNASAELQVGDFVEIYRTDGLATTAKTADPGGTFKRIIRHALTAGEIAGGSVTVVDAQQVLSPYYTTDGVELYTNPYQEGSTAANRQPDICKAMATFKGFTFFGNITERAQWEFSVPAGINDQTVNATGTTKRQYGLGIRTVAGTVTNGSAVITGVNAANLVGIVREQLHLSSSPFPFGSKVIAVGVNTITMSANATANAASVQLSDSLEISGNPGYSVLAYSSFASLTAEVSSNRTLSAFDSNGDSPGIVLTIESPRPYGIFPPTTSFTIRATNGANYSPPVPELATGTAQTFSPTPISNLLRWSKDSEPEHVPAVNETRVGSGAIISMVATKDALWIACTDGVYRLSGDAGVWRVDLVAPGCVLCAPRCMVNMRETIHAYTNYGFGAITDSGFVPISHAVLRSSLPGPPFSETADMLLGRNDSEAEVLFSASSSSSANPIFVYNTLTKAFTYINAPAQHFAQVTAFAWQENPASGVQTTLWGLSETGSSPSYICWNSTAAHLDMRVSYLSIDGEDPVSPKQWSDFTLMFLEEAAGYTVDVHVLTGGNSFTTFATGIPIAQRVDTDACATVGIPRDYALSPVIKPGFSVAGITANRVILLGISLRYTQLSLQREVRQ